MNLLVRRGVRAPGRARLAAHRDARASGRRQGFEAIFSRFRRALPAEPGKYRGPCAARERERESCVQGAPGRARGPGQAGAEDDERRASEEHRGAKHAGGAYRKSTGLRGPMMRRPWPNKALDDGMGDRIAGGTLRSDAKRTARLRLGRVPHARRSSAERCRARARPADSGSRRAPARRPRAPRRAQVATAERPRKEDGSRAKPSRGGKTGFGET